MRIEGEWAGQLAEQPIRDRRLARLDAAEVGRVDFDLGGQLHKSQFFRFAYGAEMEAEAGLFRHGA